MIRGQTATRNKNIQRNSPREGAGNAGGEFFQPASPGRKRRDRVGITVSAAAHFEKIYKQKQVVSLGRISEAPLYVKLP
jgi:hypothetical protein